MKKNHLPIAIFLILLWSSPHSSKGQNDSKFEVKGYLKFLHSVNYIALTDDWITDNTIHNRLDFKYYASKNFTFEAGMRNQFFYGEGVKQNKEFFPNYDELLGSDVGFFDLTWNWASGDWYVLNTTIDRLFVDYSSGDWQVRLGRHRINWGQNLIWNPNDVFNAYSYFDFDYEERPGTDALRVQYYPNYTSTVEFVYQLGDSIDAMSFMGLYRFNKWSYDIQFLSGVSKEDLVIGTGWAGDIKGGGFRGEFTYFHNKDSLNKNVGQLVASVSADYTFPSSLYIQGSYLYNSIGTKDTLGIINISVFLNETSAKNLTRSRGNIFGQVGYQISPLWRGDVAAIVNPYDKSWFISPMAAYSLSNNIELLMIAQIFQGDKGTEYGDLGAFIFGRFRWSF